MELEWQGRNYSVHPPVGMPNPELKLIGFIKGKKQDVVVLFDDDEPTSETIDVGPLSGQSDPIGKEVSERALVINARSQVSSVSNNIDTMTERLFAETLNLHLRLPKLVMGEVYVVATHEYDDEAMKQNEVGFKSSHGKVERFIREFEIFSGRKAKGFASDEYTGYKYERSALVLADFRENPPSVYLTLDGLRQDGLVDNGFEADFEALSPKNFAEDLLDIHRRRHEVKK